MKKRNKNLLWFILIDIVVLFFIYLFLISPLAGDNLGTDDASVEMIESINANYSPWISSVWEPKTEMGEVLLFAFQFTIGAGVIVFFIQYMRRKRTSV